MKAIITKYYQPAIVFILTFSVASIFSVFDIDTFHHGVMFKPAFDVVHGQTLFRDTFTQYGALTTLLQSLALRLFGHYLIVIQIETAFFYALISVCLYYIWRRILPDLLTTISVIIWLFLAPYFLFIFHPWSSVYALFFQTFSFLLVLLALEKQKRLMIMFAGCIAVLTFWCRQPVGVLHCISLVFFLTTTPLITGQKWKSAMTDCAFFIAGIIAASLPFLVWLAFNGAIYDMYLQSIKAAFLFGSEISSESQNNIFVRILMALFLHRTYEGICQLHMLWNVLPIICLFLLVVLAIKRWRKRDSVVDHLPLYGLLIVSLASWMQYYPVNCARHCYWAATPMIGLFTYAVWKICMFRRKDLRIIITIFILVLFFGFEIKIRIAEGYKKISAPRIKIEEPNVLRGMYLSIKDALALEEININFTKALQNNSFHYMVNLTYDPLYLTFIGPQKNFHPLHGSPEIWNKNIYPGFKMLQNKFINEKHPIVLWWGCKNVPGWTCIDLPALDVGLAISSKEHRSIALYYFTDRHTIY